MLFSGHLDHLAAEGYDVDDTVRSQALMPQQEMLMKMFAVSSTIKFVAVLPVLYFIKEVSLLNLK